jgi:hypothetical protein
MLKKELCMRVKQRLALGVVLFLTATVFSGSAVAEPILEKIERTGSHLCITLRHTLGKLCQRYCYAIRIYQPFKGTWAKSVMLKPCGGLIICMGNRT